MAASPRKLRFVIIGAGMAGLLAGIRLKERGDSTFTIYEKGDGVNGVGDTPNRHDVLTGSQADGTAFPGADDRTCKNWTSSTQGAAMLGHLDRRGLNADAPANDPSRTWNSAHPSRGPDGGCSQADLRSTGGDGLLYCFAAN